MCEPYPGPRCSYDAGKKVVSRRSKALLLEQQYGPTDPRTLIAQARLQQAITEYQATPDGIAALENTPNPDADTLHTLQAAKLTRKLQQQALQETRNGRPEAYTTLLHQLHPYHTPEEIHSILETAREQAERQALLAGSYNTATEPTSQPTPTATLIAKTAPNLTQAPRDIREAAERLQQLEQEQPLTGTLNHAYQYAVTHGPTLMKKAMRRELTTLARIHGIPEQRIAAYYEAYKKQYNNDYAHLAPKDRPDPPAHWVTGEFPQAGQTRHPLTAWLPRDPAATYALSRLRHDPEALPDHERTTTAYVACLLHQETDDTTNITLQPYTPAGKPAGNPTQVKARAGRLNPQDASQVDTLVTGRTLLTSNSRAQIALLKAQKHIPLNNTLQPADLIALNDEYPDYQTDSLLHMRQLPHSPEGLASLFFQNKKNGTAQWGQKTARKQAAIVNDLDIPTSTRWDKLWSAQ